MARPGTTTTRQPRPSPSHLRSRLLRWYARHRRDLPWRRTRDPYAIWVSEIMLQQTQVTTVLPYYDRFLARFPDVAALAEATEEEVLGHWSGLGYYRRARSLHAGAREVVARHHGRVPSDPTTLRELPGVGRYTAGAIASIAFGLPQPILDGNVRRVLARIHACDGARIGWAQEKRQLWEEAARLAEGVRPGDLNQALMELGALVCTPAAPACPRCPVRSSCRARAEGDPEIYPARRPRPATRSVRVAVAWVRRRDRMLVERPGEGNPLRGAWDLPAVELPDEADARQALAEKLADAGIAVSVGPRLATRRHAIMNRRLGLELYRCGLRSGRVAGRDRFRWMSQDELPTAAVSGATRKLILAASA